MMLKYNLILAVRSILKRKFISLIILISLTIGLVCTFYISGFTYNELTVDKFNKRSDRIYGILSNNPQSPEKKISFIVNGAPQFIKKSFPEVSEYCQVWNQSLDKIKIGGNDYFSEFRIIETSPSFFTFFSFPLISGNVQNVLSTNQLVVVSKEFAQKYFGNIDVIGKSIEMNINGATTNIFCVSGVFDNSRINSHLTFDMVISNVNKEIRGSYAYLMVKESANPDELGRKLIEDKNDIPALFSDIPMNYYLQSLKGIYFTPYWESKIIKSRNIQYIYIAIIIGILVLMVACFNYFNLIFYQLIVRTREIAIKKVLGARVRQSGWQLFTECALLIGISALFAVALLKQSILFFNRLTESDYLITDFFHPAIITINLFIIVLIGIFSWLLIYRFIRNQKSVRLLNSSKTPKIRKQNIPLLIVFQFAASVILITSTLMIMKQVHYIQNKDIGIDKSVIHIQLGIEKGKNAQIFRDALRNHPAILNVSVCECSPLQGGSKVLINYKENGIEKVYTPSIYSGDYEYLKVSGIKLLDGEQFSINPKNTANKCIINKALADLLEMKNPVGKLMNGTDYEIIGISDNFLFLSLENPVEPAYITYSDQGADLLVKLNPALQNEGIRQIKQCWSKLISDYPFDYITLGDQFNLKHKKEVHLVKLITTFCILSIFISLIGLLALSLFSIQQRTKEIGIRKAAGGAKTIEIMLLLNKDFIKWVTLAFIIASPIAWYAMHKWLENFAYKTTLSWWIFALAGIIAMGIALLTVSLQAWRAARRNPVESLRYE